MNLFIQLFLVYTHACIFQLTDAASLSVDPIELRQKKDQVFYKTLISLAPREAIRIIYDYWAANDPCTIHPSITSFERLYYQTHKPFTLVIKNETRITFAQISISNIIFDKNHNLQPGKKLPPQRLTCTPDIQLSRNQQHALLNRFSQYPTLIIQLEGWEGEVVPQFVNRYLQLTPKTWLPYFLTGIETYFQQRAPTTSTVIPPLILFLDDCTETDFIRYLEFFYKRLKNLQVLLNNPQESQAPQPKRRKKDDLLQQAYREIPSDWKDNINRFIAFYEKTPYRNRYPYESKPDKPQPDIVPHSPSSIF